MTTKTNRSYRLSPAAMANLAAIHALTGSNYTAIVEQAAAWYLAALRAGCVPMASNTMQPVNTQAASKPMLYIEKS